MTLLTSRPNSTLDCVISPSWILLGTHGGRMCSLHISIRDVPWHLIHCIIIISSCDCFYLQRLGFLRASTMSNLSLCFQLLAQSLTFINMYNESMYPVGTYWLGFLKKFNSSLPKLKANLSAQTTERSPSYGFRRGYLCMLKRCCRKSVSLPLPSSLLASFSGRCSLCDGGSGI